MDFKKFIYVFEVVNSFSLNAEGDFLVYECTVDDLFKLPVARFYFAGLRTKYRQP